MPALLHRTFVILLLSAAACVQAIEPVTLKVEDGQKWYRGNMHTHSHWSDGNDYLESIASWYQDEGYQFLVFTDHNVLADNERWVTVEKTKGGRTAYDKLKKKFPDWVDERGEGDKLEVRLRQFVEVAERFNKPDKFLLIQGEEISDRAAGKPVHMNASNIQQLIDPQGGRTVFEAMDNNVRAVLAQREATGKPILIHLNHPNFGFAVTAEDLLRVRGERFFEVFNGHPGVRNHGDKTHASTERLWDIILAQRIAVLKMPMMYGLATDDGHDYHNMPSRASEPGRGWVVVLSKQLTAKAMIESLEAGRFYSSSGVTLRQITADETQMTVEVDPKPGETYTIEFVGTRNSTDLRGEPIVNDSGKPLPTTHRYSKGIGEVLQASEGNTATYKITGDEYYVRARVTSSALHPNPAAIGDHQQAWVQPIRGPAAPN